MPASICVASIELPTSEPWVPHLKSRTVTTLASLKALGRVRCEGKLHKLRCLVQISLFTCNILSSCEGITPPGFSWGEFFLEWIPRDICKQVDYSIIGSWRCCLSGYQVHLSPGGINAFSISCLHCKHPASLWTSAVMRILLPLSYPCNFPLQSVRIKKFLYAVSQRCSWLQLLLIDSHVVSELSGN